MRRSRSRLLELAVQLIAQAGAVPCVDWPGSVGGLGYGTLTYRGKRYNAHRYVYLQLCGPVPASLVLDHLCRNRACVNPAHLEPVTQAVNLHRGDTITARNASRTQCPSGHDYDGKNTYISPKGHRRCRECARISSAEHYAKRRAS